MSELRVLLVADDSRQIRLVGQGLQRDPQGGVSLEGADSLATARRRLAAGPFDLALLDFGLGGLRAVSEFRSLAPELPVIVLAPAEGEADAEGCLAIGAHDFLAAASLDCPGLADRLRVACLRARADSAGAARRERLAAGLEAAGELAWYWERGGDGVWISAADPSAWDLPAPECRETIEGLRERIHPDDRERLLRRVDEALASPAPWQLDGRLKLGSGGYRWVELRGRARMDARGRVERAAGLLVDAQRQQKTLRELNQGRRQLRAVFDSEPVPQAVLNASGLVTDCNQAWLELASDGCYAGANYRPGERFLPEAGDERIVGGLGLAELARGIRQVLGGVADHYECSYGEGERRWRMRVTPLLNPGIAGAVVRHQDIAGSEADASRTLALLAAAQADLEALPGPCFRLDAFHRVTACNARGREFGGGSPEGRDVLKRLPRGHADAVAEALAQLGGSDGIVRDATPTDGPAMRWLLRPRREGNGVPRGFLLLGVEVADLLASGESRALGLEAANVSPAPLAVLTAQGKRRDILWHNAAFAALAGDASGRSLEEWLRGAGTAPAGAVERALRGEGPLLVENGRRLLEMDFGGAGSLRVLAVTEVTERELKFRAVNESHQKLVRAFRGCGDGQWEWDAEAGSLWLSPRSLQILGLDERLPPEKMNGALEAVVPSDRARLRQAFEEAVSTGEPVVLEVGYGDPVRWLELRGRAGGRGAARQLAGTLRDVSASRETRQGAAALAEGLQRELAAEREARDAEHRRNALQAGVLEAMPGMVARFAADGRLAWANRAWQETFPDARDLAAALGRERFAELEPRLRSVAAGEIVRSPLLLPLDGEAHQLEAWWIPQRDEDRKDGVLVVLLDLTEQREADLRLFQARKMEALGQLTGGIAHEFNNVLGVVLGNLQLIEGELSPGAGARRRLRTALGAAEQGASVTKRLLAFTRQQDLDPEVLESNDFVGGREGLLRRRLGEGRTLALELAPEAWPVLVDPAQLEMALLQLVANADDALSPSGGRVTISTTNETLDADGARRRLGPSAVAGDYLVIAVADDGPGVPEELAGRVFDPFFTTKPPGRGAGLGLSMVWGFAQQSGGRAALDSRPGGGARVSLWLPRHRGESRGAQHLTARVTSAGRVLVVEPDAALRETASALLASMGWQVESAADAAEAVEAMASGRPDLLFTELAPGGGMDGLALARRALAKHPRLAVLFTTGYGRSEGAAEHPVLDKPYGRDGLEVALKQAMSGAHANG